jgi:hypothetical protein
MDLVAEVLPEGKPPITNYQIIECGSNDLFYAVDDVASVRQECAPPYAFVLALIQGAICL